MPAAPSSLTDPAIGQLLTTAQALGRHHAQLLPVLAAVPDPRARRGVRHRLTVILGLAVCAVLAGARSFTAIAEWAADADQGTREELGVTGVVPCESTFRRTLQNLDADALDDAAGAWAQQRTAPPSGARRMIAVDGKTLRGSAAGTEPGRHLLAALDHAHGVVLGQVDVEAKTNEIPMFARLLDRIDLAGAVVTADALHAQRAHAEYLAGQRGAHYLITVKGNQPGLHAQLASLPWRQVPVAHRTREQGHGRAEQRILKVTAVAAGLAFPHAAQAIQIIRRRRPLTGKNSKKWSHRDHLRHHLADRHPSQTSRARGHRPGPLVNRRPPALGPRHGLGRGPVPDPRRQRPSRHGQPAQPGDHHLAPDRGNQHRRCPALPRAPTRPTAANDHELLVPRDR
jgi:predicted transposase YbfD/YdcC